MKRFYNNDWIKDAETKGVLSADEARELSELRDMVARVIAVDDFAASELTRAQTNSQDQGDAAASPERQHIAAE